MKPHEPIAAIIACLAGTFLMLGPASAVATAAFAIMLVIPSVLILAKAKLEAEETLIIGALIGLGIIPLMIYYANMLLIPSFRLASVIVVLLLLAAGLLLKN